MSNIQYILFPPFIGILVLMYYFVYRTFIAVMTLCTGVIMSC